MAPSKTRKEAASTPKPSRTGLTNYELVVIAAFLAGAHKLSVDTEDIAIKSNEIAPGRFSWRKYPEQINIDTVRKRLWDATKLEKGALLIGSERNGWRLTKAGYDFVRSTRANTLNYSAPKVRTSRRERTAQTREINRLMREEAFLKYHNGAADKISKAEVERFFRLDDYITGNARAAKIERLRILAASNESLTKAIEGLTDLVRERRNGGH